MKSLSPKSRPLHTQVLLVTGATSGIGLSVVRLAVREGAKVFMMARNEDDLQRLQDELRNQGFESAYAVADVAEEDQVRFAADECVSTFGRIDTFINNAGISIYGKLQETETDEAKRLFDTNFWGVVNGCKVAVSLMKDRGGRIINIGSVLSYVGLPLQGMYSASKHAVKAYTDTLRREIMAEHYPIQVTLVVPGAINSPYPEHARSHIGEPAHTPPVYETEVVAKTILKCCESNVREIGVGASSFILPFMDRFMGRIQDRLLARYSTEDYQRHYGTRLPREFGDEGNLFKIPSHELQEFGHYPGHVMKSSLWTEFSFRKDKILGGVIAGMLGFLLVKNLRRSS